MAGRAGFLGGLRGGDAPERDADAEFGSDALIGGAAPWPRRELRRRARRSCFAAPPGFDPVWGTLGASIPQGSDDWRSQSELEADGVAVDVEIFGNGFQISG